HNDYYLSNRKHNCCQKSNFRIGHHSPGALKMGVRLGSMSGLESSVHCFLHERADPCLLGGGQLLQREGRRPNGSFVEMRLVAEPERRIPCLELLRVLEEA